METLAHMAASAEPATIVCDSCDEKFTSSQQYEKHLAEVHEKKPKSVPLIGATDDKSTSGPKTSDVPTPTRFLAALPKDLFPTGGPAAADASGATANPFDQSFAEAQRSGGEEGAGVEGAETDAAAKLHAMREEHETPKAEGQSEASGTATTEQAAPADQSQQQLLQDQAAASPGSAAAAAAAAAAAQGFVAQGHHAGAPQAPRPRAPVGAPPRGFYTPAQLPPGPRPPFSMPGRPPMPNAPPPPTSLPMVAPRNSTPGSTSGGIKRTLSGADEGEVDSEEDKKRRNRAAAQRCRLKKKKQVAELEGRSVQLQRENQEMRAAQARLMEELNHLKQLIHEHKRTCTGSFPNLPGPHPSIAAAPNGKTDAHVTAAPTATSPPALLNIVPRKPSSQIG